METLRFSNRGVNVEILQAALSRAGYLQPGDIDGIFGAQTLAAVISFQRSKGLVPDGVAGPLTWNQLIPYLRGYTTHRVVRGDTFFSIAQRHNTTVSLISRANMTVNPNNMQIGTLLTIPFDFDVVITNISYTSDLLSMMIDGLKARYPFITRGEIGRSVMGKPLYYLAIGTGKKQMFINAAHHANEWITTPVTLKFFEEYAEAVATGRMFYGRDVGRLYHSTMLYLVPMVTPDSVDLVTGALTSGAYFERATGFAANYPFIPFPSGWKANINGVDLNLQYPAGWEEAREIKAAQGFVSPAPRDYVGPSPLSERESNAVYQFTRNNNFLLILAYHTQGSVIYWQFRDYRPPNSYEIGVKLERASGYPLLETPYESANAGYKDWFIQTYNRPGYTVEAGIGVNPLPIEQFDNIYAANGPLMAQALESVSEL